MRCKWFLSDKCMVPEKARTGHLAKYLGENPSCPYNFGTIGEAECSDFALNESKVIDLSVWERLSRNV